MRTAVALARRADGLKNRLATSGGNRKVISDPVRRADEPGAPLDHWIRRHGRTMPEPIKPGLSDAVQNRYDERALSAYDTVAARIRFGDVIDFVHPKAVSDRQRELFGYARERRRSAPAVPASPPLLRAQAMLYSLTPERRRAFLAAPDLAERFAEVGTPADLIGGRPLGETDPRAWEAVLSSGLTDAAVDVIPLIETVHRGEWPF